MDQKGIWLAQILFVTEICKYLNRVMFLYCVFVCGVVFVGRKGEEMNYVMNVLSWQLIEFDLYKEAE